MRGAIFDVVVDIRKSSSTYGQWHGIELSEENHKMFLVPEGFAHGFVTLREDTVIVYKQTGYYSPEHERSHCLERSGFKYFVAYPRAVFE